MAKYTFAIPSGRSHPPAPDMSDDGDEREIGNFLAQKHAWFESLPRAFQNSVARYADEPHFDERRVLADYARAKGDHLLEGCDE